MKKTLDMAELEAQTAVELPERDLMALITIVAVDVVDVGDVTVTIQDINVNAAANVCAALLTADTVVRCDAAVGA